MAVRTGLVGNWAADLGMSHATVQRILAQAKLQPHRLDRYMASNDPDFEYKAADIIGLYMSASEDVEKGHRGAILLSMRRIAVISIMVSDVCTLYS